jgi:negative regulator of flagellin synthesis FlgM
MRISGSPIPSQGVAAPAVAESALADTAPVAAKPAAAALQSSTLQPALAAMREMPEIDEAKVAALRDALAKGELPFNPARLAGLIERFHGGSR